MSFQRTHNNYRNGDCIHKRSCRYILEGLVEELELRQLYSLTLPSTNFELEKRLWKKYEYSFMQMCEINTEVFDLQKSIVQKEFVESNSNPWDKMIAHCKGDICTMQNSTPFNFIWMDFCGYFTESLYNKLKIFLKKNELRSRGVFAITLQAGRENKGTQKDLRELQQRTLGTYMQTLQNFRSIQLPKIFVKLLSEVFPIFKFELTAKYSYKPTSGGCNMTMYAFSWESK